MKSKDIIWEINNTKIYLFIFFSVHATILRDLLDAFNDINNKPVENQDQSNDTDYRYQIVNSFLASNGDYKIDNRMY